MVKITYIAEAVPNPAACFEHFWNNLPWEQRDVPRRECFFSDNGKPYTYGRGLGAKTYYPAAGWDDLIAEIKQKAEADFGVKFEACFCNGYNDEHDSLNWHADDSEVIDHKRPILVFSFGAKREIWYKGMDGIVHKQMLESGSLFVMPAGMQLTHLHRIPKHSASCGPRVSLTFRGLLQAHEIGQDERDRQKAIDVFRGLGLL
ncbi:alpha-ketoglutarate-dependent dioxygenase AlkB [Pseudomonas serbica]|uniref:alpha-ketoglutarate-dependent dioxygenase AlkB n=1 Tax=Pseudomonas serbica TaxID=2965074 RepID=UPI00237A4A7C|nr:alpha-ketoglutarate-dependent dioxygenase AlkB [Pseudomonas serbica]